MILNGMYPPITPPWVVDVRDVAKAHILALGLPHMEVGTKRFLVNSGNFTWEEGVEHLKKSHPGLIEGPLKGAKDLPGPASHLDTSRAKKILGLTEFIDPKKMVDDVVDDLIELQKRWAAAA
jgi:nucleoside-diphosphate-sugar epimerase